MTETVNVPREWLVKVFDTLTTIDGLLDGNQPAQFSAELTSDIDWLATAANVMLLESEARSDG